jgi:hypothetical protein
MRGRAKINNSKPSLLNPSGGTGKFGNRHIQYTEWRTNKFTYNYTYNSTCIFITHNKYNDNDMKNLPNNENEHLV